MPNRRSRRSSPRAAMLSVALAGTALLSGGAAFAAETPEVHRDPFPPQKTGAVHTLRIIPETCAYLQGSFTADPAKPDRFGAARTSPRCQAREPVKMAPSHA